MSRRLYLISQSENTDYDTYDSAVVCAPDEEAARNTHPRSQSPYFDPEDDDSWCGYDKVTVKLLGLAYDDVEYGVVCASFNAG
jgi:hypothetical protein